MRAPALTAAVAVAALVLTGCSGDLAQQEAAAAAVDFVRAAPPAACALLAPETRESVERDSGTGCEQAMPELSRPDDGEVSQVTVAGESAQVRFGEQVVFLARFPDGWHVTAAGCERDDPDPAVPYDCEVGP